MRRSIAAVLAGALTWALLVAAPTAQAASPTSTWTGSAGGDTTAVDVKVVGGLDLAGIRLSTSQADAGSARTPRANARSANLGATVAGLPLSVLSNTESAGPAADSSSSSPGLGVSAGGIVSLGALDTDDSARWAGDGQCVASGTIARASTTVADVAVDPGFAKKLLTTGTSTTTGSTRLAPTSSGSLNNGVTSTSTASALNADVLGLKIGIAAGSTLSATATGASGSGATAYQPGLITVVDGSTTATVVPGTPYSTTLSLSAVSEATVTVSANDPTRSVASDGTSSTAGVSVVSVAVTVKSIGIGGVRATTATSSIDLLPLRASAAVPSGGIDCPPAAPTITRPAAGSRTNDTTPTFEGTGVAGARISLEVDGTVVSSTIAVGSDGTWSYDATTPLSTGSHSVSATQTLNGTTSDASATTTFTIDTAAPSAPTLTRPVTGTTTSDNTPDYVGTAEPGATVDLYEGSTRVGTGTAGSDGSYTITSDRLDDGSHTVYATATDVAGNVSEPSGTTTFTVDATPPDAPVIQVPVQGDLTQDTTPTISGTAQAGVGIRVLVDGASVGTTDANAQGTWSLDSTTLDQGGHTVVARATDEAGNVSLPSPGVDFTVDSRAPSGPELSTPADQSSTSDATPTFSGSAETGSTVTVYEGTTPLASVRAVAGAFEVDSALLGEGQHTVYATATDVAGNVSTRSNSSTFTVDVNAPSAPVLSTPANGSTTGDRTPTYTGTGESGATVKAYEGSTLLGTGTAVGGTFSIASSSLSEGSHTVFVTATDAAGNVSQDSNATTFTVDVTRPATPQLTSPADGSSTDDTTPTYTGRAEAGSSVTAYEGVLVVGTGTADGSGRFSLDSAVLAEGPHTVFVTATDAAGNVSGASNANTFTVDTIAPAAPILTEPVDGSLTTDPTPDYRATATPGTTVTVYEDASVLGTARVGALGGFVITSSSLTDGVHTVYAVATDDAGNVSVPSNTTRFTVDATGPAAPVISSPADGSSTNDPTPTISGTAETGASVEVFVDGRAVGTTIANGQGDWSLTSTLLTEDLHTATAVATDAAGNGSGASQPVSFRVDLTAPAAPVITSPGNGVGTRDTTPTISGTAQAGASVEVFVDGGSVGTATANGSGAWTLESTPLDDGTHVARAVATDAAGNASLPSAPVTFSVDRSSPASPVVTAPADGSTVADSTPTTRGTAEADVFVEVFVNGETIGTVQADGLGRWTLDAPVLVDGAYTVTARATDAAGNSSPLSTSVRFTIDTTGPAAPVVTEPADGAVTTDRTPTIRGTAEAGASVEVFVDDGSLGTVTATGGTWSIDATVPLDDGLHFLSAVATDRAGNAGTASPTSIFFVDGTAPAPPVILVPLDGSATADSTPTISGTAEVDASVEVFVDGSSVGRATANGRGAWTLESTALDDGGHTARAVATDQAGNASLPSAPVLFTVDTTPPAPPVVTAPADGSTTTDPTPTVRGTATEGVTVNVAVGGLATGSTTAGPGSDWSLDLPQLLDGSYTVSATTSDALGNTSAASNAITFTVDTTAPATPTLTTPANGSSTRDTTPTYAGTAEAGSSVEVYEGTRLLGTGTATGGAFSIESSTLDEGEHTVFVTATDAVGNVSGDSNANTFTIDTSKPDAPVITAPEDGTSTNDPTPTVTGTSPAGSSVEVFVDGTSVGPATVQPDGSWTIDLPAQDEGTHTVTATATDPAGNTSDESPGVGFTVDTTAPAAPAITSPTADSVINDTTPTITGTAAEGATVQVFEGAALLGTATADGQGDWSLESSTLSAAEHTVTATATDRAGNVSGSSPGVRFTIDTTVPATPVLARPADGSSTNDTTPTFTGTAEAGSTVTVYEGGTLLGTGAATGGSFSIPSTVTLEDGEHTVFVTATDEAGNVSDSSDANTFTIDTTKPDAPVITAPEDGTSTNDPTPTVTGTSAVGSSVEVFVDGTSVGPATVAPDGSWTIDLPGQGEGRHTVTATATDPTGNVSDASEGVSFTVDTSRPALPVITAPGSGSTTASTSVTVKGTADPDASSVRVFVDGTFVDASPVQSDGTWSLDLTDLADGTYTLTAISVDRAGNESTPSAPVTFTVDTAAPTTPTLTTPADGTVTTDATPTYTGTAEAGSTVKVYEGSSLLGTGTATDGSFTIVSTSALDEGSHTVFVTATDAVGNVSGDSNANTFRIDTTKPDAPVITAPDDGAVTGDATPTVSGSAEAGASVEVFVDGASVGPATVRPDGSWSIDLPTQPDGTHTVTATATDPAGNTSEPSEPVDLTVDTAAPDAPSVTSPADGSSTNDTTPTIGGTAEGGSTVEVFVDGSSIGTTVAGGDGQWSLDAPAALDAGGHTVTATATDEQGNVSEPSAQTSFTVDLTAPAKPVVTAPANGTATRDTTPTISGTAEARASVEVSVDGSPVGTTTADGQGAWTLESTALTAGTHTVTAVATDAAGNSSQASDEVAFTVDLTAPQAPVITTPADGSEITDATPTLSGTAEAGATLEVFVDGESIGTTAATSGASWSIGLPLLGLGAHEVAATATDTAGNVSPTSSTDRFTVVPGTTPAPVVTSPAVGDTVDGSTVRVCGTGAPGATIVLSEDGDELGTAVVDDNGNWCADVELRDGEHTIDAVQILPDGAVSALASRSFRVGSGNDGGSGSSGNGSSGNGSGLAATGGPSIAIGVAALVLLASGTGALVVDRRRRRRS